MAVRNYSNTAAQTTLVNSQAATDTSIALAAVTGDPTVPFTASIARGTSSEEVVLVTALVGTTATVVRGYDGTAAQAQAAGATFQEVVTALDFREANAHVNTTGGAHGTTSAVVGVSDTQTLTNKTLTSPTLTNPTVRGTIPAATVTTLTVTGATTASTVALTQVAAPAGTASEDTVWAQTDGGLYVAQGVTVGGRLPVHWGSVTAFPAAARIAGDTCHRSDLGNGRFRFDGTNWRQGGDPLRLTLAQRVAIAAGDLYDGLMVYETDTYRTVRYSSSLGYWRLAAGAPINVLGAAAIGGSTIAAGAGMVATAWTTINSTAGTGNSQLGGTLRIEWTGSGTSPANAAAYWQAFINATAPTGVGAATTSYTAVPGSYTRWHNNSTANTPINYSADGFLEWNGAAIYTILAVSPDPAGNAVTSFINNCRAWIVAS